jgi:frataxin
MQLDESRFAVVADQTLEKIADLIDDVLGDKIDVEFQHGILTITLEKGGQYVLNKHGPNREIWLSSPVSGAWHFAFADNGWVSTREPRAVLAVLLADELAVFGEKLVF